MAISVAINKALATYIPAGIKIKWPNDIYYFDKKIGGILIENVIAGSAIKTAVIGIGLNVNQQRFNADLAERATSLAQILQQDVSLSKLLNEICSYIESWYLQLKAGRYTNLKQNYVDRLYQINEASKI
jgi:BirA family biotin operon repressor/biotin-[acetyl-CoA-carboxylase] ligase